MILGEQNPSKIGGAGFRNHPPDVPDVVQINDVGDNGDNRMLTSCGTSI